MANNLKTTTIFKESSDYDAISYVEDDYVNYAEDFEGMDPEEIFGAGLSVGEESEEEMTLEEVLDGVGEMTELAKDT